jgi:hypothetical protein
VHTVEVYAVVDAISTTVEPTNRPGFIGRSTGIRDADIHYVEVDDAAMCLVLNSPLGTVRVVGTGDGVELDITQATALRDLVSGEQAGSDPTTRVVLRHDGDWAAMVHTADLDATEPVTGIAIG